MAGGNSILMQHLLALLDTSTSPEIAIKSFSAPCFSLEDPNPQDKKTILIFLAYLQFIVRRRPDASINGIWEKLLRKTIRYSHNISGMDIPFVTRNNPTVLKDVIMSPWLCNVLISDSNCLDPYIRLELFRLFRLFQGNLMEGMESESTIIASTMIKAISEIEPRNLYLKLSDSPDCLLFDFMDLSYLIAEYGWCGDLSYVSHCIQLFGIFADNISSITDPMEELDKLRCLCELLGVLLNCMDRHRKPWYCKITNWDTLRKIASDPEIRVYIVETVCKLTSAIINCKHKDHNWSYTLMLRDKIAMKLNVCTKTYDIPRLLFSRQIGGPILFKKHALLMRNLEQFYHQTDRRENVKGVFVPKICERNNGNQL